MKGRRYLVEAIELALDGMNAPDALTSEQITELASSLEISLENEGTATGRDMIPNPMEAEVRRIKSSHQDEVRRLERREEVALAEKDHLIRALRSRIYDLERENAR